MDLFGEISVKTTKALRKRVKKKNPNSKFFTHLIQLLDDGEFNWMLRYVPGSHEKEFEVIFTDRKNKKVWKKEDIALFVQLDKYMENIFERKRSTMKYEESVKIRFKSNMCKCVKAKFIEKVGEKKFGKCKTLKKYKILQRPPPFSASVLDISANDGNNKKSKRKSEKRGNRKVDNKKNGENENVSLKGSLEIAHFASVFQGNCDKKHFENICQDDNFFNFCEEDNRNASEDYNSAANFQMEMEKSEDADINMEDLICFVLDENPNVDPSVYLNNSDLTIRNASGQKQEMINTFFGNLDVFKNPNVGPSMYLNNQNSKIGNVSDQKQETINVFIGNLNAYTNPECDSSLSQGNQVLENKFENEILKSDPYLCNVSKECLEISNSLGEFDDWPGTYQALKPMEYQQSMRTAFGNENLEYS